MTPVLLDTCIVIDVLRGNADAETYLASLDGPAALSVVSIQELFAGARDREIPGIEAVVTTLDLVPVSAEIARRAGELTRRYFKSHGTGTNDCFIAATAEIHDLPLATLNLKHFPMFPDLARPYG